MSENEPTFHEKEQIYLDAARKQDAPDWVPAKIVMLRTVRADRSGLVPIEQRKRIVATGGEVYETEVNQWGAVSAKTKGGLLGVKPNEFEVVAWKRNDKKVQNEQH